MKEGGERPFFFEDHTPPRALRESGRDGTILREKCVREKCIYRQLIRPPSFFILTDRAVEPRMAGERPVKPWLATRACGFESRPLHKVFEGAWCNGFCARRIPDPQVSVRFGMLLPNFFAED